MSKNFLTCLQAGSKLGTSALAGSGYVKKSQLVATGLCNEVLLTGYGANSFVVDDNIALPIHHQLFEYPGTYPITLSPGNYNVVMCGAGGSGANDGSRAGHTSSGGNSGSSLGLMFSINDSMQATIIVGKGGVMTNRNTNTNGIDGGHTSFTIGNKTLVTTGGIGGCSYDGYSAAHVGNNIRVDNQIQQSTLFLDNPDPGFFNFWHYEPNRIGGHGIRYSNLCTKSAGFSGPMFSFSAMGVESSRYNTYEVTHICSSGTGGLNTYGGERPYQNPGVNGGGASNEGNSNAPLSESHGKWPGCGGGGRNFTADHTGMGGNGADGMVLIIYNNIQ